MTLLIGFVVGLVTGLLSYHFPARRADRKIDAIVRNLLAGLKPFADHAALFYSQPDDVCPPNFVECADNEHSRLTLKEFRRAAELYDGGQP